ncbi:hypothetical protein [Azospirillum sp. Sh1]|uniref:hypothetical protein n=1 Tax=Azospirillum sp. Sh1 TaxID=2607285 RepID=UPI0011EE7FF2|nr:hypothetical protein [Azospirillum sp. Sh1]KAA0573482.1 hypothetical protein FZ029_21130 [Azospirillum sp. Sh1]
MFCNLKGAKARAKALGKALDAIGVEAPHSDCLDVIAQAANPKFSGWHELVQALKNDERLEVDNYQFQTSLMTILSDSLPDEQLAPVMIKFCGSGYKKPPLIRRPLVLENGDLAPGTFNLLGTAESQEFIDEMNRGYGSGDFFANVDSPHAQAMKAAADRMFEPQRMARAALNKQREERQQRIAAKKLFVVKTKKKG